MNCKSFSNILRTSMTVTERLTLTGIIPSLNSHGSYQTQANANRGQKPRTLKANREALRDMLLQAGDIHQNPGPPQ